MKQIKFPIEKSRILQLDELIKSTTAIENCGECEVLDTITIPIPDSVLEVDIKVVNSESGPYVDVVLFENGHEVACLPPAYDSVEGEYAFELDGEEILISVEGV